MEDTYSADDYEDEDFESDEGGEHSRSPAKRIGTPHSSKKSALDDEKWSEHGNDDNDEDNNLDVEGQDLESYMKHKNEDNGDPTLQEDLACELKPLSGYRPTKENAEETLLLHKLGYDHSHSNQSSPQKGVRVTTNSPSPSMKATKISFQSYESSEIDMVGTTKYKAEQGSGAEEYPSTRTSKDNKDSPTLHSKQKSPRGGHTNKVGFSLNDEKFAEQRNIAEEGDYDIAQDSNPKARVKVDANYIDSFKAMMGGSASASGLFKAKLNGSVQDMSSAAGGGGGGAGGGAGSASTLSPHGGIDPLGILPPKKRTAEDDRENAERVDALLMELFPERFEGKKAGKKGGKGIKKAAAGSASGGGAGYSKNQVYGLAAPRGSAALPSVDYLHSSSSSSLQYSNSHNNSHSLNSSELDDRSPHAPLMASLDQQMKLLKKELKSKDDKITRLTEHAVMMGNHMDKLKGEVALLTIQLREANGELEAKEARLQEALKQRKKAKKAQQQHMGGGGGGVTGGGADVAVVENENARLREREQALMDAIEELSNQNEDLIEKLKESMERELILSSKRAAQISHSVSALAEQSQQGNHHHLPQIGVGARSDGPAALRTQSEPLVTAAPKRATGRKKRDS